MTVTARATAPVPAPASIPAARRTRDRAVPIVALFALAVSVYAYVVTVMHHGVLTYKDALSHLEIARRVLDNPSTSHFGQLGTVWLPLPHILMLPLVWITPLYKNGFAGAVVSMISFVITTVLLYKIVYRFTGSRFGGVVAAGIFAGNINMLYMQSTPMTEALLFCTMLTAIYLVQRWAETGRYQYLVGAGCASIAAILSRYESWPIIFCLGFVVIAIAWQQRPSGITLGQLRGRTTDRLLAFGALAGAALMAWMLWGWLIDGSPLAFQDGEYAKPSLWVGSGELAIGHWWISIKTYWFAIMDNVSWPIMLAAGIGLMVFGLCEFRSKRSFTRALPVLSLLVVAPFFVYCLYSGQRPLHVTQVTPDAMNYNVRFGLFMLLPCAIFGGYLVGRLIAVRTKIVRGAGYTLGLLGLLGILTLTAQAYRGNSVATYNEPKADLKTASVVDQRAVSAYMDSHYRGGRELMESFGNEVVVFYGVDPSNLIYEGSYQLWDTALANPAGNQITWILARGGSGPDKVYKTLTASKLAAYDKVFTTQDGNYTVYRRK
jgi:hypothetical protein